MCVCGGDGVVRWCGRGGDVAGNVREKSMCCLWCGHREGLCVRLGRGVAWCGGRGWRRCGKSIVCQGCGGDGVVTGVVGGSKVMIMIHACGDDVVGRCGEGCREVEAVVWQWMIMCLRCVRVGG